ncbi:MAG: choline dehydrogenase-like flavoprotein [Polaribacter sp.]|jgi:choline dehydrogenase-like flavoprotein
MNQYNKENCQNYATDIPQKQLEYDVVIVGSGAGGGISAEILTSAGLSVLIVEEGPLRTNESFKMKEKTAYADLYQEAAGRQTKDKGIQILQGRSVGGSTTVNWTSSFRTPNQTLDYWQSEFDTKGLLSNDLNPYFSWVEKRLNISKWQIPPNRNNQLLADGANKLGWSLASIPRNVNGCANLGYCGMGCPINAKQSMLVSTIPAALANGAKLISRARVESVIIESGKAVGVWLTAMDQRGQVKEKNVTKVTAKNVVLAAGAIGSPAILLRSKIVNPNNTLGKRTFLHPVTTTIAKMKEKVNAFEGAPQSIYSDEFLWRDGVSGEMGYKIEVPPMHPALSSTLMSSFGKHHQSLMKDFSYYQANLALLRDGFNDQSVGGQVLLDSNQYPVLDYQISDSVFRGLRHAMEKMAELQFAVDAQKVTPLHLDASSYSNLNAAKNAIANLKADKIRWQTMSAHVMGGCTMGSDENKSVVNSNGEHHQIENLNVIDGSLFPTSLGVNPQLTIYSIAAKLSVNLAKKMGKLSFSLFTE